MRIEIETYYSDDGTSKESKIYVDWFDEHWWRWKLDRFHLWLNDHGLDWRAAVVVFVYGTVIAYWCQRFGWF